MKPRSGDSGFGAKPMSPLRGLVHWQNASVVGAPGANRLQRFLLAVHGIYGHDGPGQLQELQQLGHGGDFEKIATTPGRAIPPTSVKPWKSRALRPLA